MKQNTYTIIAVQHPCGDESYKIQRLTIEAGAGNILKTELLQRAYTEYDAYLYKEWQEKKDMELRETKIFISGQISGLPFEEAKKNFDEACIKVKEMRPDALIFDPFTLCRNEAEKTNYHDYVSDWAWCMSICHKTLVTCDAIAVLPNWAQSKGAKVEMAVAGELGLEFIYL